MFRGLAPRGRGGIPSTSTGGDPRCPRLSQRLPRAIASLREQPLTQELVDIRCPSLVITGERDSLCPPKASEIIHAKIPNSRLRIAPGVGHCLHWEDPAGFNGVVIDFLSSV
ncbi:MAG: alpha/beta fold hydrolase [Candidatus Rokubacteria bacterium]|nr:alpha/beta fold hydrolase [Candidatus Rokubacteria bacterium]